jgi:hypothetical protein
MENGLQLEPASFAGIEFKERIKMLSKRKPHNHYAGYVFERKHPKGHLVCVIAKEFGIEAEHKYLVVLECKDPKDSKIGLSFTSLPKAREWVKEDCLGQSWYVW